MKKIFWNKDESSNQKKRKTKKKEIACYYFFYAVKLKTQHTCTYKKQQQRYVKMFNWPYIDIFHVSGLQKKNKIIKNEPERYFKIFRHISIHLYMSMKRGVGITLLLNHLGLGPPGCATISMAFFCLLFLYILYFIIIIYCVCIITLLPSAMT